MLSAFIGSPRPLAWFMSNNGYVGENGIKFRLKHLFPSCVNSWGYNSSNQFSFAKRNLQGCCKSTVKHDTGSMLSTFYSLTVNFHWSSNGNWFTMVCVIQHLMLETIKSFVYVKTRPNTTHSPITPLISLWSLSCSPQHRQRCIDPHTHESWCLSASPAYHSQNACMWANCPLQIATSTSLKQIVSHSTSPQWGWCIRKNAACFLH